MDKVAQIGGKRIAAPPGNSRAAVSLDNAAKYYLEALELGEKMGVPPLLELWGTHPVLGPLSHGIYVTVAAGRADASLLLDVFHLYKSGTPFTALKQINGASLHVMHLNDYPQAADSSTLNDGNRVYPGDGVAPLRQILRDMIRVEMGQDDVTNVGHRNAHRTQDRTNLVVGSHAKPRCSPIERVPPRMIAALVHARCLTGIYEDGPLFVFDQPGVDRHPLRPLVVEQHRRQSHLTASGRRHLFRADAYRASLDRVHFGAHIAACSPSCHSRKGLSRSAACRIAVR